MYHAWVAACVAAFGILGGPPWQEGRRLQRAERWARVIVDEALGRDGPAIDPLLVVALSYAEAGFRTDLRGPTAGSIGLLQVHPGAAHRLGYRVRELEQSPEAQLRAGIRHMREAYLSCGGDPWRIVAYHRMGRCVDRPASVRLVRRVREYRAALIPVEPPGVWGSPGPLRPTVRPRADSGAPRAPWGPPP